MILLITGGRAFCEAAQGKPREQFMAERVALGFTLDWIGPNSVIVDGMPGAGRWAAIWAERRGARCDIGMSITADAAICFPGGHVPAGVPIYSVSLK